MYSPPLKITHPLAKWVFTAVLSTIAGTYFIFTGVNNQTVPGILPISFDDVFWVGVGIYLMGRLGFFYLRVAPRFRAMPAGPENLRQLNVFNEKYPCIAKELSLERFVTESASYGDLLKVQAPANRKVLQVASKTLIRRGRQ